MKKHCLKKWVIFRNRFSFFIKTKEYKVWKKVNLIEHYRTFFCLIVITRITLSCVFFLSFSRSLIRWIDAAAVAGSPMLLNWHKQDWLRVWVCVCVKKIVFISWICLRCAGHRPNFFAFYRKRCFFMFAWHVFHEKINFKWCAFFFFWLRYALNWNYGEHL